jgi:hypothetical protein
LNWTGKSIVDAEFDFYELNKAVMVIDLPKSTKLEKNVLRDLSLIVSKWNSKEYNLKNSNCEHFTQDLIENGLGISLDSTESPLIHKVISELKENGNYELRKLFEKENLRELQYFQNHKDLDIYKILMDIEIDEDYVEISCLLKAFDRAFWFNFLTMESKIKFLTNLKDDFTNYMQNGFAIIDDLMIERLKITLEVRFLFKMFPKEMDILKSFKFNIDNQFVNIKSIKFKLSEALMIVWEKTCEYIKKEVSRLISEKKIYEPIKGCEAIKGILSKSLNEKEMKKLYSGDDLTFPPPEEIKLLGKEFPSNLVESYFNYVCPFTNPTIDSPIQREKK